MLRLRVRVDLGAMVMKGYSVFPKVPASLEPHHQIVCVIYPGHSLARSYPSAEKQSVYFTAPQPTGQYNFGCKCFCFFTCYWEVLKFLFFPYFVRHIPAKWLLIAFQTCFPLCFAFFLVVVSTIESENLHLFVVLICFYCICIDLSKGIRSAYTCF